MNFRVILETLLVIVILLLLAVAVTFGRAALEPRGLSTAEPKPPEIQQLTLPGDYRDWKLISVAHEAGNLNDLRAILGNDAAWNAARKGTLPFPDGAMIVRLAWAYTPSEENNKAFGRFQSFIAGAATNVQLLVKDSQKFAATGGWGFAQIRKGNSVNEGIAKNCFACHLPAKSNDYVFTHYAR